MATHHAHHKPAPERPHRHHYDADMLSVEEALERILGHCHVLGAQTQALLESLGQVLAEDVTAPFDIPSLANSAMDGYALRSEDVAGASANSPVILPVTDTVAAGHLPGRSVSTGTAIRIMTGAPIPEGANAVVPFEDTDELDRRAADRGISEIGIKIAAARGDHIRPAGGDVRSGDIVLARGRVLRPGEIGLIASLGRASASVIRRPRIAIIATGDELLQPGEPNQPGFLYNSNSYSVAAQVLRYGGIPDVRPIARDTIEALNAAIDQAVVEADMVVTTAGVSKGDYDVVKDVLAQRGSIALWSVRMRPAKPLAFGTLRASGGRALPHLGLPGNPVSAMVAFEQFGRPAIRVMMGKTALPKPTVNAILDDPIENYDGRRVYARVVVYRDSDGRLRAKSTGSQSSNVLTSMATANGLAICPHDLARKEAGEIATVQMLDWPDDGLRLTEPLQE